MVDLDAHVGDVRLKVRVGFPALDYQARRIAKELEIELSETISEEQGKYDCALSADQIDSLADNGGLLTGAAGFVRL